MRGKLLTACAATALLFVAQGAHAEGFYVGLKGGMNLTNNSSGTLSPDLSPVLPPGVSASVDLNTTIERNLGGAFIAAVGYGFESGLRVEGEVGYRLNGLDRFSVDSVDFSVNPPGISGSLPIGLGAQMNGHTNVLSFMANVAYDFHNDSGFTPYIGAGAGVALLFTDASLTVPIIGDVSLIDDTAVAFAYQAMAGVDYAIDSNWSVNLEYRFFGTLSPDYNDSFTSDDIGNVPPGLFPAVPLDNESHYYAHSILVGVTYSF
jgi:opacity protein-like surface antigen